MALFCCPLWRLDLQKIEMTQPRTLNSYCMTEASSHCWRELNLIWWPRGLKLQNQCLPLVLGIPWTVITRVYPWFAGEKIKKGHEDKLPAVVCEGPFFFVLFFNNEKNNSEEEERLDLADIKKNHKICPFVHYFSVCRHLKLMSLQKTWELCSTSGLRFKSSKWRNSRCSFSWTILRVEVQIISPEKLALYQLL